MTIRGGGNPRICMVSCRVENGPAASEPRHRSAWLLHGPAPAWGQPATRSRRELRALWRAPLGSFVRLFRASLPHGGQFPSPAQIYGAGHHRQARSPPRASMPACSQPSRTLRVAARWPSAILDRRSARGPGIRRSGREDGRRSVEPGDGARRLRRISAAPAPRRTLRHASSRAHYPTVRRLLHRRPGRKIRHPRDGPC
jgi:hypothetical protein